MLKKFLLLIFSLGLILPARAIDITESDGIYHVILEQNKKTAKRLKCVIADDLMTNREIHKKADAVLTVNGGFFDPKNKKTVSYVTSDGQMVADPIFNENLFTDPLLKRNLDKILNRSEFRVLECFTGYKFEIAQHKSPIDFECQLMNAIQAGPLVHPQLQLEEEFFIVKDEEGNIIRESASVLHKVPRTILGLKDNDIHILIFTDEHPATLEEVAQYCAELNLDRAMAMDGGGSTSLNYLNKLEIVSKPENGQGRMLKSFIILKKK